MPETSVPRTHRLLLAAAFLAASLPVPAVPLAAQASFDSKSIKGLRWRHIGPFRAGRTKSAVGVPSQPNVFYMAVTSGGVWRSNDYGRT